MLNPNWVRWLRASVINVFNDYPRIDTTLPVNDGGIPGKIPFYLGFGDKKSHLVQPYWYELKIAEEKYMQYSPTCFDFMLDVGILVGSAIDDRDMYNKDVVKGIAVGMHNDFAVNKYGSRAGDDKSYVTCMNLIKEMESDVRFFDLGEDPRTKTHHLAIVEASYKGRFEG